ncbi:MAG: sigma-70 family RNA polymerase sigma factor [Planctomycetes bacterium]|nr:sigma-70 family RNA polymerase sigma factor [Planctomycetota bacterium]
MIDERANGPADSDTCPLLARARSGDDEAREELALRHYGKLRFYIRARLGRSLAGKVEIDDVVQETYLRAFRDIDKFTDASGGGFYLWLATVARHVLADVARAARTEKRGAGRHRALERADWSAVGAATAGPRTRAWMTEQQQLFELAFLQLSPNDRRLIALRQWEERPAREVARLLGMTETSVHTAYRRALHRWAQAAGQTGNPQTT